MSTFGLYVLELGY